MEHDSNDSFIDLSLWTCPSHDAKEAQFYCNIHKSLCCTKCLPQHLDCQVKHQFHDLEEMQEDTLKKMKKTLLRIHSKTKDYTHTTKISQQNLK